MYESGTSVLSWSLFIIPQTTHCSCNIKLGSNEILLIRLLILFNVPIRCSENEVFFNHPANHCKILSSKWSLFIEKKQIVNCKNSNQVFAHLANCNCYFKKVQTQQLPRKNRAPTWNIIYIPFYLLFHSKNTISYFKGIREVIKIECKTSVCTFLVSNTAFYFQSSSVPSFQQFTCDRKLFSEHSVKYQSSIYSESQNFVSSRSANLEITYLAICQLQFQFFSQQFSIQQFCLRFIQDILQWRTKATMN